MTTGSVNAERRDIHFCNMLLFPQGSHTGDCLFVDSNDLIHQPLMRLFFVDHLLTFGVTVYSDRVTGSHIVPACSHLFMKDLWDMPQQSMHRPGCDGFRISSIILLLEFSARRVTTYLLVFWPPGPLDRANDVMPIFTGIVDLLKPPNHSRAAWRSASSASLFECEL